MRYIPPAAQADWVLLEVVRRGRRPCSDAYADANDGELVDIFHALRLLRAAGQPPDQELGNPEIQKAATCRFRKLKRSVDVYVLKAKPSGWRLYFYVRDRAQREVEFLYAVHKKKWARDPADIERCESILAEVLASRSTSEAIFIPPR